MIPQHFAYTSGSRSRVLTVLLYVVSSESLGKAHVHSQLSFLYHQFTIWIKLQSLYPSTHFYPRFKTLKPTSLLQPSTT